MPQSGTEQVISAAALVKTCKIIKNLFDSGCTHAMVRELRYLVPGTVIYFTGSSATVANGQKMEIVASSIKKLQARTIYPFFSTKSVFTLSYEKRWGFPRTDRC